MDGKIKKNYQKKFQINSLTIYILLQKEKERKETRGGKREKNMGALFAVLAATVTEEKATGPCLEAAVLGQRAQLVRALKSE